MDGKGPTILQIIPHLDAGGAEIAVIEMAEAVTRAGGRALVLCEGGRLVPDVRAAGGEVIEFPAATKNPIRILSNAEALGRIIAREGVRLVHARSRAPAWSGLIAARRAKIPFVTTYHGAYKENGRLKNAYNSVMARGDAVIANSAFTAGLIRARYGTPEDRITVIHRGLDPAAFNPATIGRARVAALRRAWGVADDTPVVLQAARLTAWKGQAVLIESAALLKASGRIGGASLILAGDAQGRDDYVAGLKRRILELGLADCVHIVGHVSDMPAAYLAAHVTVIGSTEPEAFGRTVIEAGGMGCPVIATNIGAPPETIKAEPNCQRDQATGWLVPPGDAWAMAEAIARALRLDAPTREAMGARARRHVLEHFTRRNLQTRTLAVYDRLLGTTLERRFKDAAGADDLAHGREPQS